MEPEEFRESEQAEFNAGIATLQRMDELKRWLDISTVRDDYPQLFLYLKAYYKELMGCNFKDPDKQIMTDLYVEVRNIIINYQNKGTISIEQLDTIDDFELRLRALEQSIGLNMPKKKDSRWGMARK